MTETTLKQKTAKGLFWGGFSNGLQQLIGFGIYVEKMAGMPQSIMKRVNEIIAHHDLVLSQVCDEINNLDVNNLTPIEALNILNDIKRIEKGK